jgi:uncharacterized protein
VARIVLVLIALLCFSSHRSEAADAKIATGANNGTYIHFGKNIADVAKKKPYNMTVEVLESAGSIDNITTLTKAQDTPTLAIVQSDILGFLKRSKNENTQNIAKNISLIFPFYDEEVHILARTSIKGLRELQGKRVIVGEQGSGNMMTATNIMRIAEVTPTETLYTEPAQGIVALLSNKADALIFVGGKPVSLFQNLANLKHADKGKNAHLLEQVHFVPIDDQRVYSEYLPTRIEKEDYSFSDATVLTAKVSALLVTYDNGKDAACEPLLNIAKAIANNMDWLIDNGHEKWKNVALYGKQDMWKNHPCIWKGNSFIPAIPKIPEISDELSIDLLDVIRNSDK